MKRLRISGLVKLMNQVRDSLSTGIPAGDEENFRMLVRGSLRQVEVICREHKTSPDKLPPPTYRAYCYLKELDLKNLPVRTQAAPEKPTRTRIKNLISTCQVFQKELGEVTAVNGLMAMRNAGIETRIDILRRQIQDLERSVETALEDAGSNLSSLSNPSQRAYSWIRYLNQGNHLEEHISTLQAIQYQITRLKNQSKLISRRSNQPVLVELFNLAGIYWVKQGKDGLRIQAHEGFVGAQEQVIEALVLTLLIGKDAKDGKGQSYLSVIKAYTQSSAFRSIASELDIVVNADPSSSLGQHFDLEIIFDKVNRTYFEGKMAKPNLTWNKTLTHRKFGHYQAAKDTVMVSISLDQATVPAYVVEFVMYHELLHKQLGITTSKGRQYAHTRAFREAEARFRKHRQAEAALNRLGTKLIRGKL
jgi:hypothetical protein